MCLDAQATFRAGMEGWLKRMAALYSSERERRTFLINNLHHILGRYGEAALTEGPDVVRETIPTPGLSSLCGCFPASEWLSYPNHGAMTVIIDNIYIIMVTIEKALTA